MEIKVNMSTNNKQNTIATRTIIVPFLTVPLKDLNRRVVPLKCLTSPCSKLQAPIGNEVYKHIDRSTKESIVPVDNENSTSLRETTNLRREHL